MTQLITTSCWLPNSPSYTGSIKYMSEALGRPFLSILIFAIVFSWYFVYRLEIYVQFCQLCYQIMLANILGPTILVLVFFSLPHFFWSGWDNLSVKC